REQHARRRPHLDGRRAEAPERPADDRGPDQGLHLSARRPQPAQSAGRPHPDRPPRPQPPVRQSGPPGLRVAHDHRLPGPVQPEHRHRLPARERARRNPVRLRTARHRPDADGAAQHSGNEHAARAHADEPPARNLHLLLPRPPVHARSVSSYPLATRPTPKVGHTTLTSRVATGDPAGPPHMTTTLTPHRTPSALRRRRVTPPEGADGTASTSRLAGLLALFVT